MRDLLNEIRDCLKDVHIEDGTEQEFDRVCQKLSDSLASSKVYELGFRCGQERLSDDFKTLLRIGEA